MGEGTKEINQELWLPCRRETMIPKVIHFYNLRTEIIYFFLYCLFFLFWRRPYAEVRGLLNNFQVEQVARSDSFHLFYL